MSNVKCVLCGKVDDTIHRRLRIIVAEDTWVDSYACGKCLRTLNDRITQHITPQVKTMLAEWESRRSVR